MRKLLPLVLLSASACAPGAAERISIDQVPAGAMCDARALGSFIGRQATPEIAKELMGSSRSHSLRWVPHGGMVTMEHNPRRLTIQLDQQNRIASLNCG